VPPAARGDPRTRSDSARRSPERIGDMPYIQHIEETPRLARARFWFAFALFLLLMALAHGAAQLNLMPVRHDKAASIDLQRVIFTIWVAIALLTPALCFHVFSRSDGHNSYWRAFWTFAYLALLTHLYWAIFGNCHGDFGLIYDHKKQIETGSECLVEHPKPDFFLAAWWGLDVVLAWTVSDNIKWVRVQRGAVHLLAFVMFFSAFVMAEKAGIFAHLLGILMVLIVSACFVLRLIVSESDPKSLLMVLYVKSFHLLNLFVVWHKLPTIFGLLNIGALREVLRAKNLHDTSGIPITEPSGVRKLVKFEERYFSEREDDGQYNDLSKPTMGNASDNPDDPFDGSAFTKSNQGARFGRNIPLSEVDPTRDGAILDPSPRLVSNRLLARPGDGTEDYAKADIINLLAAAWIQFQTHDWFNHGTPRPIDDDPFDVPLPPGDVWPGGKMLVRRTRADPTRKKNDGVRPETFVNAETHWWDSSQIYGDSPQALARFRAKDGNGNPCDGKLAVDDKDLIRLDPQGIEKTGLTSNWWLGLSLLHNIFTREHNAICDYLIESFPEWQRLPDGDAQIFRVARLVNSALMAKIHTVDWTPAILQNPALQIGMNANWWGLLQEPVKKYIGRISKSEAFSGIPGSATNHNGADYCLTEEFTAVYRLHPLLPNDIQVVSATNGRRGHVLKFESNDPNDLIIGPNAMNNALRHGSLIDIVYTFGVHKPGAVTLRNFPNWMRRLRRRNGHQLEELVDLAAIDILRDRERGVPRYNRFRELFHLPRVRSFEQMTDDPELARALKEVYGHVDKVDLMVGMYAEKPPEGFGFSDTAFRVFILMASRRLKSDRFFTNDYTPAVYTKPGIDWIENNNMTTVLQRHFPELTPVLQRTTNAFAPWPDLMNDRP
jgi:Animal haem peroxidase